MNILRAQIVSDLNKMIGVEAQLLGALVDDDDDPDKVSALASQAAVISNRIKETSQEYQEIFSTTR